MALRHHQLGRFGEVDRDERGDVRETIGIGRDPRAPGQMPVERSDEGMPQDSAALRQFGDLWDGGPFARDSTITKRLTLVAQDVDDRGIALLLDPAGPRFDPRNVQRCLAEQRRRRLQRLEIAANCRRFANHFARIEFEGGHRAARIDPQIGVAELLVAAQIDHHALDFDPLFRKVEPHPARARGPDGVIEFHGGTSIRLALTGVQAKARGPRGLWGRPIAAKETPVIEFVPIADIAPDLVEQLLDRAFGADRHLRTAYQIRAGVAAIPELSFAAMESGALVGTIQCWPIRFEGDDGNDVPMIQLGPVAVEPARQQGGIGRALTAHALDSAEAAGLAEAITLIGDPEYYGRFGFSAEGTSGWTLPGPWAPRRLLLRNEAKVELPVNGMLGPAD